VRDLRWSEFKTTVHIEVDRVKCPECGVRIEKVPGMTAFRANRTKFPRILR
jgi:transposase